MSANEQQTLPTINHTCRPLISSSLQNERGVAAVFAAMLIFFLVAFSAFAVDLGFAWVTQNELQNIADAGALAAGSALGAIYEALPASEQQDPDRTLSAFEKDQILAKITQVAGLNMAGGKSGITIDLAADVEIGTWDFDKRTFTPTNTRPTAVTVIARRDGNANGPIGTFFANVMGYTELNVTATAIAALGPVGTLAPGEATLPVGISKRWFQEGRECGDDIRFHPTGDLDGCAGWHTYTSQPASASKLDKILADLKDGTYESPQLTAGQTSVEFVGGTLANVFENTKALYEHNKDENGNWDVKIPVYDSDDCDNPNQSIKIVGFVDARVTTVIEAPEKQIIAKVLCHMVEPGRTGGTVGSGFGPLATIPVLVS